MDVLLPSLYHGAPVLAYKFPTKFDPKQVEEICRSQKVKHVFFPPTALKMMKQVSTGVYQPVANDVMNSG